jgi:hypothetical protein
MNGLRSIVRRRFAAALATLALAAGVVPSTAAAATVQTATSGNWAGYVATGKSFSSVAGSWVVPTAKSDSQGYSATWVGLGGASGSSSALEQVGTQSDYVNGKATYTAWYELVPKAAVTLKLTVHPGDHITAKVTVDGTTVTVSITDTTTGRSTTKVLRMADPDTSSAEWIAEAPSVESGGGYQVVPLADFGKVTFTRATATAAGHTGAITNSDWTAERIDLIASASGYAAPVEAESSAEATASTLAAGGSSFSVSWSQSGATEAAYSYGYGGWGHGHGPGV